MISAELMEETKEISKRAAEKAKKKAEKAAKKAELALRPKPEKQEKDGKADKEEPGPPLSIFELGWLKKVYEEKPVASVRTRFPPEPNGYLHIGHAKAIAVDFGFAKHYNGETNLRYDDTNPEKEAKIYFDSILEIVTWLGFKPTRITYSSDNFDLLYELAEKLILKDKAYVCSCSRTDVNLQRGGPDNKGPRYACPHRNKPVEQSLAEFRAMKDGKYKPGEVYLRMKQSIDDPTCGNPQMWDIAAYRVLENHHHPRTGDKWVIYPTYDFAHCLCDAIEGITHSLCTSEFEMSRASYDWLCDELDYKNPKSDEKGPMQREFGRLKLEGTILSKRRIIMLVEGATFNVKKADGTIETKKIPPAVRSWDDPRLHTLVAIRRRGVPPQAILEFVSELGVTTADTVVRTHKFDSSVRKYLERKVPRLMLVLDPIKVVIDDLSDDFFEELTVPYDPKKPEGKLRKIKLTKTLFIDRSDFREVDSPDFFRLAPDKVVGLLNAPFPIKATTIEKDESGKVVVIHASKAEGKPKAFIHWVNSSAINVTARQYSALFSTENPNELDWSNGGYAEELNPKSEVAFPDALIEPALSELQKETADGGVKESDGMVRFQAIRTAYFAVDPEKDGDKIVLNQIVTLKEDSGKGK